jgi:LysM repeat protein
MTAPEPRPDIESTLADAFRRRHAGQPVGHPSLVDVRRRAHRRSSRSAAMRTGAVVAAGAAVLTSGWAVTRDSAASSVVPGAPASEQRALGAAAGGPESVTLSVDGLWSAVAARLGTTVEQLRAANPSVDFTEAPVPGVLIQVPGGPAEDVSETTVTSPAVTPTVTAVYSTVTFTFEPAVETTITMPSDWTPYVVATGDFLYGVAERFCTTADELVAGNGWAEGVGVPLYPGRIIAVPADAC